jgi:hypothetical protein
MPQLRNRDPVSTICAISLATCLMSLKLRLCLIPPLSFLIIPSFTNVVLVSPEDGLIRGFNV